MKTLYIFDIQRFYSNMDYSFNKVSINSTAVYNSCLFNLLNDFSFNSGLLESYTLCYAFNIENNFDISTAILLEQYFFHYDFDILITLC